MNRILDQWITNHTLYGARDYEPHHHSRFDRDEPLVSQLLNLVELNSK